MKVLGEWTQRARVTKERLPELSALSLDLISLRLSGKKVTKLGQQPRVEVGAAGISIKLMRRGQIKTVFRINSCPWASCSELAFWFPGAAAGVDLGGERKWGLTAEGAWQGGALRSCLSAPEFYMRAEQQWQTGDNRRENWSQTEESKSGNWKT